MSTVTTSAVTDWSNLGNAATMVQTAVRLGWAPSFGSFGTCPEGWLQRQGFVRDGKLTELAKRELAAKELAK